MILAQKEGQTVTQNLKQIDTAAFPVFVDTSDSIQ